MNNEQKLIKNSAYGVAKVQEPNDKIEYYFYEWLICAKNISKEDFEKLSSQEFLKLRKEFVNTYIKK
jgi:hypothetical protein